MQDGDEDCGEKKAHRGRIDWSPGKCFAFPLMIKNPPPPRESGERGVFLCLFSHMQFLFGI